MDALKKQGVTVTWKPTSPFRPCPTTDRQLFVHPGIMSSGVVLMIKTKHLDITLFENARANGCVFLL